MQVPMFDSGLSNTISGPSQVRFLCWSVGFWPPGAVLRALKKIQCSNATTNVRFWSVQYHIWTLECQLLTPRSYRESTEKNSVLKCNCQCSILSCPIPFLDSRLSDFFAEVSAFDFQELSQRHWKEFSVPPPLPMFTSGLSNTIYFPSNVIFAKGSRSRMS